MGSCILGIGVDTESIARFDQYRLSGDSAFLRKVYTEKELEYCFSKEHPAPHLAVRFAAKEAVIKALHGLNIPRLHYREIEVTNDRRGVPAVACKNSDSHRYVTKLSLSHSEDHAIAFVIVTETVDHDR